MALYKIVHKEELVDEFFFEADSEEEALDKYYQMAWNGEIDYSDMEMVDSSDVAYFVKEDE